MEAKRRPEFWEQIFDKCRHFNGLINDACDAGVNYTTVAQDREPSQTDNRRRFYPCFRSQAADTCTLADFPTEEEAKAKDAEAHAGMRAYFGDIGSGICPVCKDTAPFQQIGPCVYCAKGHRLYQGRLPKKGVQP